MADAAAGSGIEMVMHAKSDNASHKQYVACPSIATALRPAFGTVYAGRGKTSRIAKLCSWRMAIDI